MMSSQGIEEQLRQLCERNSPPFDEAAFADRLRTKTSRVRRPAAAPRRSRGRLRVVWYAAAALVMVAAFTLGILEIVRYLGADRQVIHITDDTPVTGGTSSPASGSTAPGSTLTTAPSESAGEWAAIDIPGAPAQVAAVALSDGALLMQAPAASGGSLYAYSFDSGQLIEIPVAGPETSWPDIQGSVAFWWEGAYDEATNSFRDQHLYSYDLATNEKREILTGQVLAGTGDLGYPQISATWFTWTDAKPWDNSRGLEEFRGMPIHGLVRDASSGASAAPVELAASPVAAVLGDASWTYALSNDYLAWEQAAPEGGLARGLYVLDLGNLSGQPRQVATEGRDPSLCEDILVYTQDGVRFLDLSSGETRLLDAEGDYATAGPGYAVYFRPSQGSEGGGYEIVARGFSSGQEQVLSQEAGPPWLSTPLAASQNRVAFVTEDYTLHVYEWKGASE